ncbi:putative MFS monocarboxylate transporter [Mytilinidion resinicola]|uniref:MFS monocarboxylate transporter n=1 Tax=Mytilinidion resinicola TaxID=574789 RepID=A0A6A6YGH1_9PEZI|nr:putative MFS monocarboxylate transporter [Mytilinidion resinicola]KAF2806997.1 putative MFS monocarboxylate transporter [Mytilinidion resinicola]
MALPSSRVPHEGMELQNMPAELHISQQTSRNGSAYVSSLNPTLEERQSPRNQRRAILTVIAAFTLTFTGCGLNFAFGVYQELYETLDGPFSHASPAAIDLIGTLAVSLMTICSPLATAWTKAYSPRTMTLIGGSIFLLANVLASFGQQLWHFLLTQGVMLGCGTCLTFIPAMTIAPGWFDGRRGFAMGIILSGTGVGGVVWAPALRSLNASIGFRNTLRLTGGIAFILICTAAFVLKWDPDSERRIAVEYPPTSSTSFGARFIHVRIPLVNWRIARSKIFVAEALGAMLQAAAYYTPVYFFSSYARTLGYSAASGASFIAISNASSAMGKVVLGYIADRTGRLNTLLVCTIISAISALGLWFPSTSAAVGEGQKAKSLFIAFTILYGIFAGAYVSLFPTVLVELFGVQHFASVNGFLYMVRGFGTLLGTPIAGALIHSSGARVSTGFGHKAMDYTKPSVMVGSLLAAATVSVFWIRLEAGGVAKWKA